jgi:hypothetical protein
VVGVRQAADPDSRVRLVAGVDRDQQRRELLDDPRHLERAGVDRPQAGDLLDQPRDLSLVGLAVSAQQDVLGELGARVRQHRGADRVQPGDNGDPVGDHFLGLLGG